MHQFLVISCHFVLCFSYMYIYMRSYIFFYFLFFIVKNFAFTFRRRRRRRRCWLCLPVQFVEKVRHCQLSVHVEECCSTFECFLHLFLPHSLPHSLSFLLAITQCFYSAGNSSCLAFCANDLLWLGVNVQSGIMVNGIGKLLQHLQQMDIKILTTRCC